MSLLQKVTDLVRRRGNPLPAPQQQASGTFLISLGLNNLDVAPIKSKSDQLDNYVGWVYGCVSKIAQDLRTNPKQIWVKKGKRKLDWDPLPDKKVPPIFTRPNLRQSWGQFFEMRNIHKDITGEAYWHLITNRPGGPPQGIELIQPDWVDAPVYNADRTDIIGWKVEVPGTVGVTIYDSRDIITDFYPNPRDLTRGSSPIEAFALAHHLDIYTRAYGLKMIRDGAAIGQYVKTDLDISEDQASAIEDRLSRKFRTPGRLAVFAKGASVESPGIPIRDLDMLRILKPSMDQVLGIYGVPRSKFGITDGAGMVNERIADKSYQENCLLPRLLTFDELLNLIVMPRIFGDQAVDLWYESESPVEVDREFMLKKAETKFTLGCSTVNQFCQEIGDEAIGPDGDVYFIPSNVTVVAMLEDAIALPAPQGPDPGTAPADNPAADTTPADGSGDGTAAGDTSKTKARKFRLVPLEEAIEEAATRISKRLNGKNGHSNGTLDNKLRTLARENTELRFLRSQESLERTAKSKIRSLFSREYKEVKQELEKHVRHFSVAEKRDWIDTVIERMSENWREVLRTTIFGGVRAGWALLQEEIIGALQFKVFEQQAAEFAAREAGTAIVEIQSTTIPAVREIISRGIERGDSVDVIARELGNLYDGWKGFRAETIARTETANAMGYGRYQAAVETNRRIGGMDIRRSWAAVMDDRTRHDHANADADVNERNRDIRLEEHYIVGGHPMQHPGDRNAPASQVINCRCTETYRDVSA